MPRVNTKERLHIEFWKDGGWIGFTDEKHVGPYREFAEKFLQENPDRYFYPYPESTKIRISYYEGR